jgi:hypothetical protein
MKSFSDLKDMDKDDLLGLLGLETRSTPVWQWVSAFAMGLLVGAGVALYFAPRTAELRAKIKSKIPNGRDGRAASAAAA